MVSHIPTANEVETFSGRYVDTKAPDPATIHLPDIAHALSQTCRYGGHCFRHYSVAEHSVFCSIRLERKGASRKLQMAALHHDDAEAYLGDIPRPLKPLLGQAYIDLSDRMDRAIVASLGLDGGEADFHNPSVKAADSWALLVEAKHLLPSGGRNWSDDNRIDQPSRIITPDYWLDGIAPRSARTLYLARHKELSR